MAGFNFLSLRLLIRFLNDKTWTEVQSCGHVHPSNNCPRNTLEIFAYIHKEVDIMVLQQQCLQWLKSRNLLNVHQSKNEKIKYGISIPWILGI